MVSEKYERKVDDARANFAAGVGSNRTTIKISLPNYWALKNFRRKDETINDALTRLFALAADAKALVNLAKTNPEYQAWKAKHDHAS